MAVPSQNIWDVGFYWQLPPFPREKVLVLRGGQDRYIEAPLGGGENGDVKAFDRKRGEVDILAATTLPYRTSACVREKLGSVTAMCAAKHFF